MIRFIKHIAAFFSLLAALLLGIYFYNLAKKDEATKINARVVAIGDSHMACDFRPQFYPHSANVSQTAEPLITSYFKTKKLIKDNPDVDTLIIGISYNTFSDYNDEKFIKELWADNQLGRTTTLMDLKDYGQYPVDTNTYLKLYFKNMFVIPISGQPAYFGEYIGKGNHLEESNLEEVVHKHFYADSTLRAVSNNSLNYLNSILSWTTKHHVQPIVICPPLHADYRERVPQLFKITLENFTEQYRKEGFTILNFSEYPMADSLYTDHTHLDREGAKVFTKMLKEQLSDI